MAVAQADLQQIGDFVQQNLAQWITHVPQNGSRASITYEIEIRERIVRVEEELKHQRELMREGFDKMDQRFEAVQKQMDLRFEAVNTRFEDMMKYMNSRFSSMQWLMGIGFTVITVLMSLYHFIK